VFLKRAMQILGGLLLLLLVALSGVAAYGYSIRHQHVDRPVAAFAATADSVHLVRGEHISRLMCAGCHASPNAPALTGGADNILAIPKGPTFGVLHGPNLTSAGVLARYDSDGLLARAIREGIGWDGRPLLVMPSAQFRRMSDEDLSSVIAYLRSQPAVEKTLPKPSMNLLGCLILGLHVYPNSVQPALTGPVAAVAAESTVAYGEYSSYLYGCRDCHGETLHGGKKGQLPPLGPNLAALAASHPQIEFDHAVRGGVSPSGRPLDPTLMPWTQFAGLEDVEVAALYRYLVSLR
jgi:mono/diheme cytochrome c family protein